MNIAVKYGLVLGIVVGAMGFVLAVVDLHTSEMAPAAFIGAATAVNVIIVFLALRQTSADSAWGGQILNGLILGAVGAVVIFLSSFAMTAFVFPEYYTEFAEAARTRAIAEGLAPGEIEARVASASGTPASTALSGAIGTIVTSLVVAAVLGGYFKRAR